MHAVLGSHTKLFWADEVCWVNAATHSEFQAIFSHATVARVLSPYADSNRVLAVK